MAVATCTWCGTDEDVMEHDPVEDIAWCHGAGHVGPRMFHPKREATELDRLSRWPGGIAADLGLYEDLLALATDDVWADTIVFEYRYAIAHPDQYQVMLDRWGHVSRGPRRYSTTSFIGSTLGQLSRSGDLACRQGRGTGWFSYNSTMGLWALDPAVPDAGDLTWAAFAEAEGLDAQSWPL